MGDCKAKLEKARVPKGIMDYRIIRTGPVRLDPIFSFHDFLMTKKWKDYKSPQKLFLLQGSLEGQKTAFLCLKYYLD